MPLSPSFPDWLLKRDPTLAGALTNPLFLAFEERRLRQGSGVSRLLRNPFAALQPHYRAIACFFAISVASLFGCGPLIVVLAAIVLGWVYFGGLLPRHREEMVIPNTLSEVVSGRVYLPILRDIWACPATSMEFFEALVLEARRASAGWAILKSGLFTALTIAAFVVGLPDVRSSEIDWSDSARDTFALLSILLLAPAIAQAFYWNGALERIEDVELHLKVLVRSASHPREETVRTGIVRIWFGTMTLMSGLIYGASLSLIANRWFTGVLVMAAAGFIICRVLSRSDREAFKQRMGDASGTLTMRVNDLRETTLETCRPKALIKEPT
jgi:hypothetical protein